ASSSAARRLLSTRSRSGSSTPPTTSSRKTRASTRTSRAREATRAHPTAAERPNSGGATLGTNGRRGERDVGMVASFRRASDQEIARLLAHPDQIESFLYDESLGEDEDLSDLDVDKAWHGIHYLLTGSAWG